MELYRQVDFFYHEVGLGRTHVVGNRCLSDTGRRPTGIRTRCKRCNAAEGDVARFCGLVVCPVNTGDLAVFGLIGRSLAKAAVTNGNRRRFLLGGLVVRLAKIGRI